MDVGAPGSSGLLGSLRGFADGLLGSVHDRFELLSIELHEEKHRLIQLFVWISVAVFGALLALTFVSCAIAAAFWDTPARVPVVAGIAVAYAAIAALAAWQCRRRLARQTRPFTATLAELRADRACLQTKN